MMLSVVLIFTVVFRLGISGEIIQLPASIMNNNLSMSSAIYLCHMYLLNNSKNVYLQGFNILDGGKTGNVHHLLLYECSNSDENVTYSGVCGKYNARLMPESIYRHCQTQIIVAWAQGGQQSYNYPAGSGLQMRKNTRLLLEVHFDPFVPHHHAIGIQLRFYSETQRPIHEIGVLTLGTLARSPLFLPPGLETIRFPTYCFNDCLQYFLQKTLSIHIFSILLHAHRRATRITLDQNDNRLIDQNPFEFHRQQTFNFNQSSLPQITRSSELTLTCYYSTRNDHSKPIVGGHDSNDEMCQAFLYYYPKIPSFPLCLSLPVYTNSLMKNPNLNWTENLSMQIKREIESNSNHLGMCGDNLGQNLRTQLHRRTIVQLFSISTHFLSSFYIFLVIFLFLFTIYCYHEW